MKKFKIIVLVILTTCSTWAQSDSLINELNQKIINKIKNIESTEIIPYYSKKDSKWGLMNSSNLNVLTTPLFSRPTLFSPDLKFRYKRTDVIIDPNYEIDFYSETELMFPFENDISVKDSIDGHRGFEVDENGNLTSYSNRFKNFKKDKDNISNAFKIKKKYYAIVNDKNGYKTIIGQNGEPVNWFDYQARQLEYNRFASSKKEAWFFICDKMFKRSFINDKGHEIMKNNFDQNIDFSSINSKLSFGYKINSKNRKQGVLDLTTMEWIIKPQEEFRIYSIDYSSKEYLRERTPENRDKVNIYIRVENTNSDSYFIDLKQKKYIPTE